MATSRAKRHSSVFSRDEIGVEQLQSLKENFADGDLNEKEFVGLFHEIVDSSLSETQLTELFQKIDANSDGTVDWDELTNYMFLSGSDNSAEFVGDDATMYYDTSQQSDLVNEIGEEDPAVRMSNYHKDSITRVLRIDKPYQYLTASKDGTVRTWNANTLSLQSVIATGRDWITDCSIMRRSNRLAISSMNRTLGFYDLNSGLLIGEIQEYSKKQAIPLCLEYVEKPADDREALVIGDDTGGITIMTCSDQWLSCDGRNASSTSVTSGGASGSGSNATSLETQGFSSRAKFKKHTDWVTRVKWVNDIRAIVATSLDSDISIIDVDRMVLKFEYNRHKKGVFDLVWCASTRLIASCGMERDISIWNPYSSQRAVATLRGHTSSVLQLASDDDNYQITSVASDNTIKVWDVRNHRCVQTITDRNHGSLSEKVNGAGIERIGGNSQSRIATLFYDEKYPCLLTGTNHLKRWPFKVYTDEEKEEAVLDRPICLASYNGVFNQIVTAEMSTESIVKTWSAETGEEICRFASAHGQSPVTAICFDSAGRRLLTGSHDGELINMWNFSNGALVKKFLKEEEEEEEEKETVPLATCNTTSSIITSSTLSEGSAGGTEGAETSSTKPPSSTSSKKRKVRDIVLLPSTFGMKYSGLVHGADKDDSKLPSPTKTRLDQATQAAQAAKEDVILELRSLERLRLAGTNDVKADRQDESEEEDRENGSGKNHQREVTCILDIERNIRVGMGDFICQRFVCSVGWDREIYIWIDKNDESEALPIHILPNESTKNDPAKTHTMDILSLVYLPPAYIATAGLDGKILLWSLNSGEFVSKLYESPEQEAIEAMVYAPKLEMFFAGGESGHLICIDRSIQVHTIVPLDQKEGITSLCVDKSNAHLISGDASGMVKLWDLSISKDHNGIVLDAVGQWQVGIPPITTAASGTNGSTGSGSSARIVSLDFVEHFRFDELYILVSCENGEVSMWTLDGVCVGIFGKHHQIWQLGKRLTYLSLVPEWIPLPTTQLPHLIKCLSITSLNATMMSNGNADTNAFLLEDSMPKGGEVWICLSGHRARVIMNGSSRKQQQNDTSSTTNNHHDTLSNMKYLHHRLMENSSDVLDVITVIKVARGEILCWDGLATKHPSQKTIQLNEFVRKGGWIKQPLLTHYIGRMFTTTNNTSDGSNPASIHNGNTFRVNSIAMTPAQISALEAGTKPTGDELIYTLIDTNGNEQAIRPLNECTSMARIKLREGRSDSGNGNYGSRQSIRSSSRRMTPNMRKRSFITPSIEKIDGARTPTPPPPMGGGGSNGAGVGAAAGLFGTNINYTTTTLTNASTVTLPSLPKRDKRQMGGILPKRSNLRVRHDASMDFRRVHNPEDIPKNFKMLLQQRLKTGGSEVTGRTDKAHHIHHSSRHPGGNISTNNNNVSHALGGSSTAGGTSSSNPSSSTNTSSFDSISPSF